MLCLKQEISVLYQAISHIEWLSLYFFSSDLQCEVKALVNTKIKKVQQGLLQMFTQTNRERQSKYSNSFMTYLSL